MARAPMVIPEFDTYVQIQTRQRSLLWAYTYTIPIAIDGSPPTIGSAIVSLRIAYYLSSS